MDCGCEEYLALDDNWKAELPTGVSNEVSRMRNEEVEEVLVVEAPDSENEEYTVELSDDWRKELGELLEGPDLLVVSEWAPEMDEPGNEYSFSMTTTGSRKKQCLVCLQRPSCTVGRHIICNHLPWFAYPRNTCWQCKVPVPQISRFK